MKWQALASKLNSAFSTEAVKLDAGIIFLPTKPFNLNKLAEELATTDEELYAVEDGEVRELLRENWSIEKLLTFVWDSFGPMSSAAVIELLDTRDSKVFICLIEEMEPWRVVAALEPKNKKELYSRLFKNLILESDFDCDRLSFGSLPTRTVNYAPHLILSEAIKESYWKWMEWAVDADYTNWVDLRDEVIGSLKEPNHLKRSLEILRELPKGLGQIEEYLAKQKEESREMSLEERRHLLKVYFAMSYSEANSRQ